MKNKLTFQHTIRVLYFTNFFQAIGSVFPIILVAVRSLYNLSYTQFGILVVVNFTTQVASDILFSKPVDKYGFRPFTIAAPIFSSVGLVLFALSPRLFPSQTFLGFCLGIFLFAAGGGLQELLLSPILDALPIEQNKKARSMSLLHSFFAWGQIFVVLVTTFSLALGGQLAWSRIILIWALVPLVGAALYLFVPLKARVKPGEEMPVKQLFKSRVFVLALLAIICGGAAEVTMAQWASAFIERGLALPKLAGDLLGVCGFSLMLALGRTFYGIRGGKTSIHKLMIAGSLAAGIFYLVAAFTPIPAIGLLACCLTGLSVSLLWPGSVIIAARHLPLAGASMFAILSAMGDIGASGASLLAGRIADVISSIPMLPFLEGEMGLRVAIAATSLFAFGSFFINIALKRASEKEECVGNSENIGHTNPD